MPQAEQTYGEGEGEASPKEGNSVVRLSTRSSREGEALINTLSMSQQVYNVVRTYVTWGPMFGKDRGILRAGQGMIHVVITRNSHSGYSINNLGRS